MERGGTLLDPDAASIHLLEYAEEGFDTFDMVSDQCLPSTRLHVTCVMNL